MQGIVGATTLGCRYSAPLRLAGCDRRSFVQATRWSASTFCSQWISGFQLSLVRSTTPSFRFQRAEDPAPRPSLEPVVRELHPSAWLSRHRSLRPRRRGSSAGAATLHQHCACAAILRAAEAPGKPTVAQREQLVVPSTSSVRSSGEISKRATSRRRSRPCWERGVSPSRRLARRARVPSSSAYERAAESRN